MRLSPGVVGRASRGLQPMSGTGQGFSTRGSPNVAPRGWVLLRAKAAVAYRFPTTSATLALAGSFVPAAGFWARTRPRLPGRAFRLVTRPTVQPAAFSARLAAGSVLPLSLGTGHSGLT